MLVQANHGRRERLAVNGVPVGERIPPEEVPLPKWPSVRAALSMAPEDGAPNQGREKKGDADERGERGSRERPPAGGIPMGGAPLPDEGGGSIIVVTATDAPLLPHQCTRVAQRAGLGIARVGGLGEHWSGDLFVAFSTGNRGLPATEYGDTGPLAVPVLMFSDNYISALFEAVVEATEEAIVNALLAAETMTGRDGVTAYRLPSERLVEIMEGA